MRQILIMSVVMAAVLALFWSNSNVRILKREIEVQDELLIRYTIELIEQYALRKAETESISQEEIKQYIRQIALGEDQ